MGQMIILLLGFFLFSVAGCEYADDQGQDVDADIKAATGTMKVMVPAYFDPSNAGWATMATKSAAMPGRIYAIANPNNGPGSAKDSAYTSVITKMHNKSGKVLGYVSTDFGGRSVSKIKADVDKWYSWYSIDGIFFDEFPWETTYVSNYQTIYAYVKSKKSSALVVGNPGGDVQEAYLIKNSKRCADVLCVFETYPGFDSWVPLSWYKNYAAKNFYVLPYNASSSKYKAYIDRAKSKNVDWVYCTNRTLSSDPWAGLSTYFSAECDYIVSKNY